MNPPKALAARLPLALVCLAALLATACGGGDDPVTPPVDNRPPTIPSISSSNTFVASLPGEQITFTATATDPDGDAISFRWNLTSGSGGVISPDSGATTQWTAGPNPGTDQLRVTASDGALDRTSTPVSLVVGTAVADTVAPAEVWRADRDPYVLSTSLDIYTGYTLTIEPGVLVLLRKPPSGNTLEFRVSGRLIAEGTGVQPIFFRSGHVGANTSSEYGGLEFQLAASGRLSYVQIDRAETAIWHRATGSLTVYRCTITNCGVGLRGTSGSTVMLRSTRIDRSVGDGLVLGGAQATLRNCTISRSQGAGVRLSTSSASLDSCILLENEGYNLVFADASSATVDSTNLFPAPGAKSVLFSASGAPLDLTDCYWGISLEGTTQQELAQYLRPRAFTNPSLRSFEVIPIRTTPWSLPLAPP